MWTVSQFRAKTRDFIRSHQFECEILFPTSVPGGTSELVNILAESANLPGKDITPIDMKFAGQPYFIAGDPKYDPWTVTFRVDDNMDVYKKFLAWMELIIGSESNLVAMPATFKTTPNFYQLDGNANRITKMALNGCWPNKVGDIKFDTTKRDVMKFDVNFTYDFSQFGPVV